MLVFLQIGQLKIVIKKKNETKFAVMAKRHSSGYESHLQSLNKETNSAFGWNKGNNEKAAGTITVLQYPT